MYRILHCPGPPLWLLDPPEGLVINTHSVQVARFLFIGSHMRKGRGTPPKIVEPLNFALLRYSLYIFYLDVKPLLVLLSKLT